MSTARSWMRARRRLVGVVFLVVLALLARLSVALYQQQFTPVAMVTLYTDSVGNEMHPGAEVMVRGVQVGEVRQITSDGRGARLELAIKPEMVARLPSNVSAEMLPTTLFGERFVALILPARPSARRLVAGSVISQNSSRDAIEVERVLNSLIPLLTAAQPQKLSATLTAIAQGLRGRGAEIGRALVLLNSYLRQMNPQLPALDRDLRELTKFTRTYSHAAPDILQALNDFSITGRTIAAERAQVAALFSTVTAASDNLHAFLGANAGNIIRLSADSTATLRILARYAPEFPCTLQDLVNFEPAMDKVLGLGTGQNGLHVHVIVVPSLGRYLPGRDTPVYRDNVGPRCYPVPFPGIRLHDGTSPPASAGQAPAGQSAGPGTPGAAAPTRPKRAAARAAVSTGPGGQGLAGSPQEGELIRELAGLALSRAPASLPGWGSLLVGPLFRGAKVTLGGA
jgi:phospholipid/cholesterol/gamma-HCH transport system substrate-binding protein